MYQIHTHTEYTDSADAPFPLSLFVSDLTSSFSTCAQKSEPMSTKFHPKHLTFQSYLLTTRGPKTHSSFYFFIIYSRGKLQVYAPKLQSQPMSKLQQLREIQWLFRGLKLLMTLKCRVRSWFLIVHWFYVPCVTLFGATVLLPYFLSLSLLPNWHCWKNNCWSTCNENWLCYLQNTTGFGEILVKNRHLKSVCWHLNNFLLDDTVYTVHIYVWSLTFFPSSYVGTYDWDSACALCVNVCMDTAAYKLIISEFGCVKKIEINMQKRWKKIRR